MESSVSRSGGILPPQHQVGIRKILAIRVRNTEYRCKIQLVLLLAAAAGYRRYG